MTECDYCGREVADDEYEDHLREQHSDELGPIDRRRIDEEEDGEFPTGPVVLLFVIGTMTAVIVYFVFFFGSGGADAAAVNGIDVAQTPGQARTAHAHGTMEMVVTGERVDFSQQRYQLQADRFHFEAGNGRVWHAHATGVTLEYAMATLGIEVTENSVTYEGTTYRDTSDQWEVIVEVNGEPVDPATYTLEGVSDGGSASQGDSVRIVVREE